MDQGGSVARSRFFVALEPQSPTEKKQTMKLLIEKIRSLLHRGAGTSRVFWLQTEFSFSTRRPS
jgi:hypothetical protein